MGASLIIGDLNEVILYVRDMNEAVRFYHDLLGIPILHPQLDDYAGEFWVVFATGACKLCLHGGGTRQSGPDAAKIVFRVADIEQSRRELLARGVTLSEIRSPAPQVIVCDGRDPDGNPFSIEQN